MKSKSKPETSAKPAQKLTHEQAKANEKARAAKEQAVAGALLTSAIDRLGELSLPYVLLVGGRVFSNCSEQLVRVTVTDAAELINAIQEKRVDAEADKIVFGFNDSGDGDTKQK